MEISVSRGPLGDDCESDKNADVGGLLEASMLIVESASSAGLSKCFL